jgi:hypothetical protein
VLEAAKKEGIVEKTIAKASHSIRQRHVAILNRNNETFFLLAEDTQLALLQRLHLREYGAEI